MGIMGKSVPIALLALLASAQTFAYVGPGAGLTLLSALWGLLAAVLAAVAFLVVWPIRRWRRRRQAALQGANAEASQAEGPSPAMEQRREAEGR